jgi:hypothetical protein
VKPTILGEGRHTRIEVLLLLAGHDDGDGVGKMTMCRIE